MGNENKEIINQRPLSWCNLKFPELALNCRNVWQSVKNYDCVTATNEFIAECVTTLCTGSHFNLTVSDQLSTAYVTVSFWACKFLAGSSCNLQKNYVMNPNNVCVEDWEILPWRIRISLNRNLILLKRWTWRRLLRLKFPVKSRSLM